jgi:hypothetical protein
MQMLIEWWQLRRNFLTMKGNNTMMETQLPTEIEAAVESAESEMNDLMMEPNRTKTQIMRKPWRKGRKKNPKKSLRDHRKNQIRLRGSGV